jgi:hypothetical protein
VLEVRLVGRFGELARSRPPAALLRLLRRAGLAGVFTRSGFSTNPELVVWSGRSVRGAKVVALDVRRRRTR